MKKQIPFLILAATLVGSPVNAAVMRCNIAVTAEKVSQSSPDVLMRENIRRMTDALLSEIMASSKEMSAIEFEGVLNAFTKTMLDKGHMAWRQGYQSGLLEKANAERNPRDPEFTEKQIEEIKSAPRPKPLPKGKETSDLIAQLESMNEADRTAYLTANGLKMTKTESSVQLEQNINMDPTKLLVPLHLKLNGVHERYAQVVVEFVKAKIASGTKLKGSEITELSAKIHDIWMQDASWKAQPILEKAGVSSGQFYSLSIAEVVALAEKTLKSPLAKTLSAEEVAALSQFTTFHKLGRQDKLLDEKILLDHIENLNSAVVKTTDRVPQRDIQRVIYAKKSTLQKHFFIKDQPILVYRITSNKFEDLPEAIRKYMGEVDRTKYTPEYLQKNIGSGFALQINGEGKPDFYVIGKPIFESKYKVVSVEDVKTKNKKTFDKLTAFIPEITGSADARVFGALKTAPVDMLKMSELGYPVDKEVRIQSPWGNQFKPAGQDAFLAWDASAGMYYMINVDPATGFPLSYIPSAQ